MVPLEHISTVIADVPIQVASPWPWEAIGRLALAAALGAMIGAEREHHGRSAGFRTQLLVALGAAMAMLVSLHFGDVYGAAGGAVRVDPARIAYGIMAGVGFLGAGVLIRQGAGVRGVTTAASLWCTAAVGLAAGFGMYVLASVATLIVLVALLLLRKLDRMIPSRWSATLNVTMPAAEAGGNLQTLTEILRGRGVTVIRAEYVRRVARGDETITLHVQMSSRVGFADLVALQSEMPGIRKLRIQ